MSSIVLFARGNVKTKGTKLERIVRSMEEPHDRLRRLRIDKGFESASDAARAKGWNINTYISHENGNRPISKKAAQRYAQAYNTSIDYILTGRRMTFTKSESELQENDEVRYIPVLKWELAFDIPLDRVSMLQQAERLIPQGVDESLSDVSFALVVKDASMRASGNFAPVSFEAGDEIIIDPAQKPAPGDYCLARVMHEILPVFRQYRPKGRDAKGREIIELAPLNPAFPTYWIDADRPGEIVGKVVRLSRKL